MTFLAGYQILEHILSRYTSGAAAAGCALVFGLILAGLSYNLFLMGLFLAAAASCVAVSLRIIPYFWVALTAGIAVGFVLGILAVRMNRPIVIILTGVLGGFAAVSFLTALLPAAMAALADPVPYNSASVLLSTVGILIQFAQGGGKETWPKSSSFFV